MSRRKPPAEAPVIALARRIAAGEVDALTDDDREQTAVEWRLPPPDTRSIRLAALLREEAPEADEGTIRAATMEMHTACVVLGHLRSAAPLVKARQQDDGQWSLVPARARKKPPFAESVRHLRWAATCSGSVWQRAWWEAPPLVQALIFHAAGGFDPIFQATRAAPVDTLPGLQPAPPPSAIVPFLDDVEAAGPEGHRPREWQRDRAVADVARAWSQVMGADLVQPSAHMRDAGTAPVIRFLEAVAEIYPDVAAAFHSASKSTSTLSRIIRSVRA